MSVSYKLLSVVAIALAAGVITYAAIHLACLPDEFILIAACVAAVIQGLISMNYFKQLDADQKQALQVVGRIYSQAKICIKQDTPLSILMNNLEELLSEALRRERKIIENAADFICIVSTEGMILRANAAAKSVLGYSAEELVGQKLSDYRVTGNTEDALNPLLGADESIQKIELESQFRKKDGTVIDLLWSAHWSATDHGLFCVAHDITERKHLEERVRLILESLPAGVCVLGASGRVLFINKTARQICRISDDSELRQQADRIFQPCPGPFTIDQFMSEILVSAEPTVRNRSAQDVPVEISVGKMDWKDEQTCLVMFVDVSEKRAAEKAKQQFLAMRDESLALRRKLMDMVVHDIRGPLSSLLSTQELLLAGVGVVLEQKIRTKLEICQDEVKRIIRLLNDLLKISRYEATRMNLSLAETDMEQLIIQAVSSIHDLAQENSVTISTQTVSSKVNVDSDRILQVLFNLLSNAIKFTPRNTAVIVKSTIEDAKIRVSVSDQGNGIPEGSGTSLFLPYSQVSWKDSAEKGGTGLGLSICREIVEEHGGTIGVANNPSGGAEFWFTIPRLPK